MKLTLTSAQLEATFVQLRRCGGGHHECQVLWTGPWDHPHIVTEVVHPAHRVRADGFEIHTDWLNAFWAELARTRSGVRAQVHTHPGRAFHSLTDDAWPIIHTPGFLSLVVPRFALGPVSLDATYLTGIGAQGNWMPLDVTTILEVR